MTGKAQSNRGNRRRIINVFKKAMAGESITVGFLGGSITQGCAATSYDKCYAYKVFEWFKNTFPLSDVKYINAGIGATDSQFGCARAQDDLLSRKPDLCFVEFSVNDEANDHFLETYEGLVRKILSSDASRALMLIHNVRFDDGGSAQLIHTKVARHYEIPAVSMRDVIIPELESGRLENKMITADNLHPNNTGHEMVAKIIISVLEDIRDNMKVEEPDESKMPSPLTSNLYEDSVRYRNDNAGSVITGISGFTPDNLPQDVITDIFRKGWTATEKGSYIMFRVKGSCIGVQYRRTIRKPAPVATLTVDGDKNSAIELNAEFDEDWGDKLCLATALDHSEDKEHTVKIELTETHKGDVLPFYLVSIIVSGNKNG